MNNLHGSLQPTAQPAAPYSSRAPSPPHIHVPPFIPNLKQFPGDAYPQPNNITMSITPSLAAAHVTGLSPADVHVITRGSGAAQTARDGANAWVYAARRRAQPVLDYLYLGPVSAAKDRAFLVREGITMVLCTCDPRFGELMVNGVRRAVEGLLVDDLEEVVEVDTVDVVYDEPGGMMSAFEVVLERINAHVLAVNRSAEGRRRGKVLVCCETGNDRSATVVAAYLMAMYGLDTVAAVQFVQLQRFCVTLGDGVKFVLQAYGDILRAKADVGAMRWDSQCQCQQRGGRLGGGGSVGGTSKRRIELTSQDGEEKVDGMITDEMDEERYASRAFAPFVERDA
ncbi:protein-tyrosine phosphatase-like protein [Achaetomium macrosporum]|uniref:Protein-tyrosine phosphatase-like protein n=1 Tax=Achaetomium macrosporum TaxID=79813 RepID=A0AAN7CFK3_9PEZI|nr:protein-tyrosine phosphatase-like protein [Achaetomium macrosporum]